MKHHPAVLMLIVWITCIAAFFILPFRLENRTLSLYGFFVLLLFIAAFCGGALAASRPLAQRPWRRDLDVDFTVADRLLKAAAVITLVACLVDLWGTNVLDLAAAYQQRSDRATDLMLGAASSSSLAFQIGFLFYPAGFIYVVREIAFERKPSLFKVGLYGVGPVLMASLTQGGRSPLLYVIILIFYALNLRKQIFGAQALLAIQAERPRGSIGGGPPSRGARQLFHGVHPLFRLCIVAVSVFAMFYFVKVFFTRAEVANVAGGMFGVATTIWGVSFNGWSSPFLFGILGEGAAYLIFIFSWYLVQGFIMSNAIFTSYDGPMLFGTYGIDLVGALVRRLNGNFVADRFHLLVQMNVYGFLPSAFGSLYVDLKFFGLIACMAWGWLAGLVYRRVKQGGDPRWLLLVPFVTLGIVVSLINTPIGFSNGFTMHFWLIVTFLLASTKLTARAASPAAVPQEADS